MTVLVRIVYMIIGMEIMSVIIIHHGLSIVKSLDGMVVIVVLMN